MDCHDWAHEVFNLWLVNTGYYVLCHRLNMQVVGSKLGESQEAILTAIHLQTSFTYHPHSTSSIKPLLYPSLLSLECQLIVSITCTASSLHTLP